MNPFDAYLWAKALHVAVATLFVGGALATGLLLAGVRAVSGDAARIAAGFRRWDRYVTVPAMIGTWGLGIMLAGAGGWFLSGWLQAKLGLVVVLSALHGIQSGRLRRVGSGNIAEP